MSKIVKIRNAGAGKYLNIHGSNVTSLTPHQNVTIWEDSGSNEQKWKFDDTRTGLTDFSSPLRSMVDTSYGLNVYRTGNPYNCDVYPVSGNETDSDIVLTSVIGLTAEKIRLKNYNLYLTAASTANGANVYWAAESDSNLQKWYFETVVDDEDDDDTGSGSTTSKTLTMPQNANQKYSENLSLNPKMEDMGCAVCCACDLASYYGNRKYTLQEIRDAGVFSATSINCIWANTPHMSINGADVTSNFLSTIKSEIDQNRPVLVKYGKTTNADAGHWVVAFKYVNSASTYSDVYVLDPAGAGDEEQGKVRTLQKAMEWSILDRVDFLRKTKKKN